MSIKLKSIIIVNMLILSVLIMGSNCGLVATNPENDSSRTSDQGSESRSNGGIDWSQIEVLSEPVIGQDFNNAQEQQILQNINRLDGFFTENQGQVGNDSVHYYIQGKGVWFLEDGVVFEIIEEQKVANPESIYPSHFKRHGIENFEPRKRVVLKLNFEGCNKVEPEGIGQLPHRSNFFYGNDPNKWCTKVPNYHEIIYENIYDNIDLKYYSNENGLKYDFIVRPGGEPNDIRLKYQGAQDLFIESSGTLNICTEVGLIVDTELFIYQNTKNGNTKINGKFKILNHMTYGFEIEGKYNRDQDLVIDPLTYSTFIGGGNGEGIAIDSSGNAYVTGYTSSSNFPNTTGVYDMTHNGGNDVFVLKLNPTGSALLYSTFIGGSSADYGDDIQIDSSGNAYVTGYTESSDFPSTAGAYDMTHNGGVCDVFVLKLNPTGSALLYSTFIGGNSWDIGRGIQIDSSGNAYVTGYTRSSDFPNTTGAYDMTYNGGNYDVFVLKLNPTGSALLYSTFVGGSSSDYGNDIQIDSSGNAYVTGWTESSDFPNTTGAYDMTYNGGNDDAFVLKLNPTGSALLYSTFIGGSLGYERGEGIQIDPSGNAYVTGWTVSTDFPNTTGAYDMTHNGAGEVFVLKLNPTGSALLYSTFIGGGSWDTGSGIQIDPGGNAYVTGKTASFDFPNTTGAYDMTHNGDMDVFVLKLNPTGSALLYSTFIGGNDWDDGLGIAIDSSDNAYVTGYTSSSDFPNTTGAYDMTFNGGDVFVLKLQIKINYLPNVLDLMISEPKVLRTNSVYLYSNGTDIEDLEQNLTPHFEFRDPNEQVWNNIYFSNPQYQNSRWEVSFTPPKNAALGLYDFRVRYNDTDGSFSGWFNLIHSLLVLNNLPEIDDISISNNSALLGDSISIWINATDIEDIEKNLTIELEYRDPFEISWDKAYLNNPTYTNERWECSFNIPFDALFGNYDFRARVNDSDGNYSTWLYLNDSLLIYNTGPKVIDAGLSEISIYRTESAYLYVNGSDYETPEDMLSFYVQYKPQSEDDWVDLTGNYLNNKWAVSYISDIDSILGNYDFRVKFEDNESTSSGWIYLNDSLEVLNNLPIIITEDIMLANVSELYEVDYNATDIDSPLSQQIWSLNTNATWLSIGSDTGILSGTPTETDSGWYNVNVTIDDGDGAQDWHEFILTVITGGIDNDPPIITTTDVVSTTVDVLYYVDYIAIDDHTPFDQLVWMLETDASWLSIETNTGILSGTPILSDVGQYWVNVSVKDEHLAKSFHNFTLTVYSTVNQPPKITTEDVLWAQVNIIYSVDYEATDDRTSIDYLQWSVKTNASWLTMHMNTGVLSGTPDSNDVGWYIVNVSVFDGENGWDYHNFVLTVTSEPIEENNAPELSDPTLTPSEGDVETEFTFTIHYYDADADVPSLIKVFIDNGSYDMTLKEGEDPVNGIYTFSTKLSEGNHTYYFTASDGIDPATTNTYSTPYINKVTDVDGGKSKKDTEVDWLIWVVVIVIIIIVVLILLFLFVLRKKPKEEPVEEERLPEEPPAPEVIPKQPPPPEPQPEQPPIPETPPEQPPPEAPAPEVEVPEGEAPITPSKEVPAVSPASTPTVTPTVQAPQPTVTPTVEAVPTVTPTVVAQPQPPPEPKPPEQPAQESIEEGEEEE